jgi:AcrR family transcriptional regulator
MQQIDFKPPEKPGKRARTRRRIFNAAMRLFEERGYRQTTVADICAATDIARATFFLHFPLKSALILELSRAMAAEWAAHRLRLPEATPSETLRQLLEFIMSRDVSRDVATSLLDEFRQDFGEDHSLVTAPGTMLGEVVRLVAAAQRKRELTRDIPARELGLHFHRVTSAYVLAAKGSRRQRAARAWRLFALGAANPESAPAKRSKTSPSR